MRPRATTTTTMIMCGGLALGCGDDPADPGSSQLAIDTGRPPALVAFRHEASAEWQILSGADPAASTFEVTADGPYRVVIACESAYHWAAVDLAQYARTPADEATLEHRCPSAAYPFRVRGQVVHPGQVSVGDDYLAHTDPTWSFELMAAAGRFDVVMTSGDFNLGFDRIAIRRDVELAADAQLGSIDLAQLTSHAMVPTTFSATNLDGETKSSRVLLHTGGTVAFLQDSRIDQEAMWRTRLAPEAALSPSDRQTVELTAIEVSGERTKRRRSISRDLRAGAPTQVTLPDPVGPVTFEVVGDRVTATWSMLPAHDEVSLRCESAVANGMQRWTHATTLSRAFLQATGATSIVLELAGIPGVKPEWRHDPALDQLRAFAASQGTATERTSSGVTQTLP